MKTRTFASVFALAMGTGFLAAVPSPAADWTVESTLPLTCAQAWKASGENEEELIAIVKAQAGVCLANRDLTFPDTREAGVDAGKGIAQDCKADPHALLYSVVDKHVRRVAEAAKK